MDSIKRILSARNFVVFVLIIKMLQIPLLGVFAPTQYLFQVFPYLCVLWFLVVVVIDFFGERNLWKNTGVFWIILFLVSYLVTCFINYQYAFADNLQLIFWMALQYILIYGCSRGKEPSYHVRTLEIVAKVFVLITIVMCLLSFVLFFLGIGGEVVLAGEPMRFGLRSRRLFGIFASPNYAALFSVISIVALTYFFLRTQKIWKKVACICMALVAYFYLVLSVSTTGKISFLVAISLLCFGILYARMKSIKARKVVLAAISSGLAAVILLLPFSTIQGLAAEGAKQLCQVSAVQPVKAAVEKTLAYISSDVGIQQGGDTDKDDPNDEDGIFINNLKDEDFSFNRGDFASEDLSTGRRLTHDRLPIWQDAVQLLLPRQPVFGVSALGYMERINQEHPESFISQNNKYSMHNDFVTLLVCCGIIGMFLMLIFMLIVIKKVFAYLMTNRTSIKNLSKIWYPLIIVVVLAVSMVYSDAVLVNITIQSVVFWICLGYIISVVDPNPKSNVLGKCMDALYQKINGRKNRGKES